MQRAGKLVIAVNRIAGGPAASVKGVPLLNPSAVLRVLGNGDSPSPSENGAPDETCLAIAATFVKDAIASRDTSTRLLASSIRFGGAGGPAAPPAALPTAAACHSACCRAVLCSCCRWGRLPTRGGGGGAAAGAAFLSWEPLLESRAYMYALQLVVVLNCILAIWEYAPPSAVPAFAWWPGAVEAVCLAVYVADICMTLSEHGWRHYIDKRWDAVFALCTAAALVDWLLFYAAGLHAAAMFRFSRALRPLLGISKRHSLRVLLASLFWTIPRMADVFALLAIALCFFGAAGLQLFNSDSVPGYAAAVGDTFEDLPRAVLAIFVLQTTENYPNVANPAISARPAVATIYFVSAIFTLIWIIVPLTLAIVYGRYKGVHRELLRAKKIKQYVSLVWAFQALMGGDGDAMLDAATFAR